METVRNYFNKDIDTFISEQIESIYILSEEERDIVLSINNDNQTVSDFMQNKKDVNYGSVMIDGESFAMVIMMHSKKDGVICLTKSFKNSGENILNGLRVLAGVAYAFNKKLCYKSNITFDNMLDRINYIGLNTLQLLNADRKLIVDSGAGLHDVKKIMMI